MKKEPSITIAIPVLNEEKNIGRCLNSIFKQIYSGKVEVIIIDAGSVDRTLEIARSYPVKIYDNPKKNLKYLNLQYAKQMALRLSKSKYYTYLDADIDLASKYWIRNLVKPLEEDKSITASFTGYVSNPEDNNLNSYLTLDTFQRDPLYIYLTPKISDVVIEKRKGYWVCKYKENKIIPQGLCVFRREQILKTKINKREMFYELDNLVILVCAGFDRFAYVKGVEMHHVTVTSVRSMIKKRIRNIRSIYFGHSDSRYWTWIDIRDKTSVLKLIFWVIYSETVIFPFLVGLIKCGKHKTWLGLYEPLVVWLTTNFIIGTFLLLPDGRRFIVSALLGRTSKRII